MSHLLLSVMGAFAQFERDLIRERQREGIVLAKLRKGAYVGRKHSLNAASAKDLRRRVATGESKTRLLSNSVLRVRRSIDMSQEKQSEDGDSAGTLLSLWEREGLYAWALWTCYTLKRQDEEYFGGLREVVLQRDDYCCRVYGASGWRNDRSSFITVYPEVHSQSHNFTLPHCHAKVGRTNIVLSEMPPLLLEFWREQHPHGHEQIILNFKVQEPVATKVSLFVEDGQGRES